MNPHDDFDDLPEWEFATRQDIGILMGIWAESGGGKTLTALFIARGLASEPGEDLNDPATVAEIDKRIFYIDTDGKRAKHYAVTPGALPSLDPRNPTFAFRHQVFPAPFSPERMAFLIGRGNKLGCKVIVCDSFSLVWEGEGGVKDIHDDDAEKAVERRRAYWENDRSSNKKPFDEDKVRGDASHWKNAKTRNRRMNTRILQSEAHLIFCGHADDKMRMEEKTESFERGGKTISYKKTEVVAAKDIPPRDRWVPICEKKFPRNLVLSILLTPDAPGIPIPLKVNEQHVPIVGRVGVQGDRPLGTNVGVMLRDWSKGATRAELRPALALDTHRTIGADQAGDDIDDGEAMGDYDGRDDDFPGDREPPPPPPPPAWGEHDRAYAGATYKPGEPREVKPGFVNVMDAEQSDLKRWAATLRDMIEHAPDDAARLRWKSENAIHLLRLSSRSPGLHGWTLQFMPAEQPATESPQGDGGTVSNGAGADGPADLFKTTGTE